MTMPAAKKPLRHLRFSDIRGVAKLTTQATTGVTGIVEGVHRSVLNTMGIPGGNVPGQTRGITGLVYKSVNGVTQLVGKGLDTGLAGLRPWLESFEDTGPDTSQREAVLAALNGVMGDRLVENNNPLAIPMSLRCSDQALDWQAPSPIPIPAASGKVLLLIHGLCMNDLRSHALHRGDAPDHGEALASALDYTPVYLRYNSGLHTSKNGRELATRLEQLLTHWPSAVEELAVVAHSMGGLLIRSAVHYARQKNMRWPESLKNIVFLGTPHHGAPLERAGNWLDVILGSTPYTRPFTALGRLRSAGITDLRYGHVLDEDWHGRDRFHREADRRQTLPLPQGVGCHFVAATTSAGRSIMADHLLGDGLVPLHSALGHHEDNRRKLQYSKSSQKIIYRMNHMALLSSPEVSRQIVQWLR